MKIVYLAYQTDSWHSTDSRTLIAVCSSQEKAISQIKAYCKRYCISFTQKDENQLHTIQQTQCSEREIAFEIETQQVL